MNSIKIDLNRDASDEKLLSFKISRDILFLDHVLVIGKKDTKNPEQVILYLAKIIQNLPPDNIDNEFLYLGEGCKIIRTHTPFKKRLADNIEIGSDLNLKMKLNLDFAIKDSYIPHWEGQFPRIFINNSGKFEKLYDINEYGKNVYRYSQLKLIDEKINSNFILVKPESKFHEVNSWNDEFEEPSNNRFEEFNGIYGLDDDTIYDAFEGDPENYWNID